MRFFILFLLAFTTLKADHPIYVLLTHPRATATAFEKVMRTQENLQVFHAPFLDPYLIKKYGKDHAFTRKLPNASITFDDVVNMLFEKAKRGPVFFKESGYILVEYLKNHPEFYQNPQINMAFLIRDPAKSILSYYKKMPSVNDSIIGHRQLWEIFDFFLEKMETPPLVIDSDAFLKNPLFFLNRLGSEWNLKFNEENLKWESGYAEDWHQQDWYVEVASSKELGTYRGDVEREKDGTPKYEEVNNKEDRLRLQQFYKNQNPFYQKLLQFAIN